MPEGKLEDLRLVKLTNLTNGLGQDANREIGGPGVGRSGDEWRSRGYLPHFEGSSAIQHISFHLADSLPSEALRQIEIETLKIPPEKRSAERRRRFEAWVDSGHGCCVLRDTEIAAMSQNCLLHFDAQRYALLAWVVMPNHIHALIQPMEGWTTGKIVASWKKFIARKIMERRREPGTANLLIGLRSQANCKIGPTKTSPKFVDAKPNAVGPIWHREYWDRYIRNEYHLREMIEYIRQNPVAAGLVCHAEDWRWSSAFVPDRHSKEEAGGVKE